MALDWYVCGGAVGGGSTDVLTIPIAVDVPRTDPTLGATVILVYLQTVPGGSTVASIVDDAAPDDPYSYCLFADGLNHYDADQHFGFVSFGLIVNPLVSGINNITINMAGVTTWVQVLAVAVTGVGGSWPTTPFDPAADWVYAAVANYESEFPIGGGTSFAVGCSWAFDDVGDISFSAPAAATDEGWDWISGEEVFYCLQAGNESDLGAFAWAGAITDFYQWDVDTGVEFLSMALGVAAVSPGSASPSLNGAFATPGFGQGNGQGLAMASGAGPECGTPPPPGGGVPILHTSIRLSE